MGACRLGRQIGDAVANPLGPSDFPFQYVLIDQVRFDFLNGHLPGISSKRIQTSRHMSAHPFWDYNTTFDLL